MRRFIFLLLVVVIACGLVMPGSATMALNETHGPTWIAWEWNTTSLNESEQLVGRYDGQVVINQTANSTPPLLTSYSVTGIEPNEPHVFDLVLLNRSTEPVTVDEIKTSSVTTGQSESVYILLLVMAFAFCLFSIIIGKANSVMTLLLFVVAFLLGGYVAAAMAATNTVLSLFGLVAGIVALIGLVVTFLDIVRERSGWGDE